MQINLRTQQLISVDTDQQHVERGVVEARLHSTGEQNVVTGVREAGENVEDVEAARRPAGRHDGPAAAEAAQEGDERLRAPGLDLR